MKERKRIGILTSGGDCPGLNAVISSVVRAADRLGWEVLGFLDGFEGLLPPGKFVILDQVNTEGIMQVGGTMLGATNRGHFTSNTGMWAKTKMSPRPIENSVTVLKSLRVEALIVVGGDGSLSTAQEIFETGFPVIGVPMTIDNDFEATAKTFGFDSAVECVVKALDRLHTTASSHKRVMVLEVMGGHAGWIALYGGMAGGADVILIPEIPFDIENVAEVVRRRDAEGKHSTMIVVGEGAAARNGMHSQHVNGSGEEKMGGIGEVVAQQIEALTGKEARICVLGHLQRGGAPTALDRILGMCFGIGAVNLVQESKFGQMISWQNHRVVDVPIAGAVHRPSRVTLESPMLQAANAMGICFGDDEPEQAETLLTRCSIPMHA